MAHRIGYLREGYKTSTNTTTEATPRGTVDSIEHWSGRIDAVAKPKAIPLKLIQTDGAPLSPWHLEAIGHHQKAMDELKLARAANVDTWIEACERRVTEWKQRILETQ